MATLDETKRRNDIMRARIKSDLGRRGLTSADLAGMSLESDIDGDVTGWTWTVKLKGGRPALVYSMANEDDAELYCNGDLVQSFDPVN